MSGGEGRNMSQWWGKLIPDGLEDMWGVKSLPVRLPGKQ